MSRVQKLNSLSIRAKMANADTASIFSGRHTEQDQTDKKILNIVTSLPPIIHPRLWNRMLIGIPTFFKRM